jgi:hypothetical protein
MFGYWRLYLIFPMTIKVIELYDVEHLFNIIEYQSQHKLKQC